MPNTRFSRPSRNTYALSMSVDEETYAAIERARGAVARSKFVTLIVRKALGLKEVV